MLIDRSNLARHLPWLVATLAVAVLSCLWYVAASAEMATGSSVLRRGSERKFMNVLPGLNVIERRFRRLPSL